MAQPFGTHVTDTEVENAWHTLLDLDVSDADIATACRIVIAGARDARADTARDILATLEVAA